MLYSHLERHNDKDAGRLLFKNIHLSIYCKGLKGLLKVLHVRGCWRPNVNFIFWPHCYDRHVVSFLFSWCWGPLHRGFPRAPSVGCGLPYHISSLLSGSLLATASGVSECPLGRVWPSLPHLVSNPLGPHQRTEKSDEHVTVMFNYNRYPWNGTQRLGKGTGSVRNRRTSQNQLDYHNYY